MPHLEQRRVLFAGHVQGVGFRYATQRFAANHPVAGYVRNLEDGRVELLAEGTADALDALIGEIRHQFAGHLHSEISDTSPATGNYQGFSIRR